MIKPGSLKKGDRVGLLCPASRPYERSTVTRAVAVVEELGLIPVLGKSVFAVDGYLAGSDEERLADLHDFFADRKIAGIFCITGGYGTMRLLDAVNYQLISDHPKLIVGADDVTALLLAIHSQTGLITCYGPNLDRINSREALQTFKNILHSRIDQWSLRASQPDWLTSKAFLRNGGGSFEGIVYGGNINILVSLLGTRFLPEWKDSILCLDGVEERNDRLDRWFTSLYLAGVLPSVLACVFGQFSGCGPMGKANVLSWEDLFCERLIELNKPACFGFRFGDSFGASLLPIGINGRISIDDGILSFAESMWAS